MTRSQSEPDDTFDYHVFEVDGLPLQGATEISSRFICKSVGKNPHRFFLGGELQPSEDWPTD